MISLFGILIFPDVFSALAFGLTLTISIQLILKSNESFMFREWGLFLYASNYLLSPAITYQLNPDIVKYGMKINSDNPDFKALESWIERFDKDEFRKQNAVIFEKFSYQNIVQQVIFNI